MEQRLLSYLRRYVPRAAKAMNLSFVRWKVKQANLGDNLAEVTVVHDDATITFDEGLDSSDIPKILEIVAHEIFHFWTEHSRERLEKVTDEAHHKLIAHEMEILTDKVAIMMAPHLPEWTYEGR